MSVNCFTNAGELLEAANNLYNKGQLKEAIIAYKGAAKSGENPSLCYYNVGNAYYQLDSIPHSIAYYKSCIFLAPKYYKAYLNLAIAHYSLGEYSTCAGVLQRAMKIQPADQKGGLLLASSYRKTGAITEAVMTFEMLHRLYPDLDEPYIQIAEMMLELKDDIAAQSWLLKYPEDGKHAAYCYSLLADINRSHGDYSRELYYLEKSFNANNTQKWIYYKIISLLETMGNDLVAFQNGKNGMLLFPSFAELALLTGNIAFKHGLYDQAAYCYSEAIKFGSAGAVIGMDNIRKIRAE